MPTNMRALVCHQYGTPDVLKLESDWPEPVLKPGHVRIATRIAGVSFAVVLGIAGKHQNKPGLPYIPSGEVAGTVIDVAADVTHVKPGDRVAALSQGGGAIAERFVAPAETVWRIPDGLDDADAMIVAGTHGSVFLSLDWAARLQAGETLLVPFCGSGIGDVLLTTPALMSLRKAFPFARITALGSPWCAPMLQSNPAVDTIFAYDGRYSSRTDLLRWLIVLLRHRVDICMSFGNRQPYRCFTRLSRARIKVGRDEQIPSRVYDLVDPCPPRRDSLHEIVRGLRLVSLVAPVREILSPVLNLSAQEHTWGREYFQKVNSASEQYLRCGLPGRVWDHLGRGQFREQVWFDRLASGRGPDDQL